MKCLLPKRHTSSTDTGPARRIQISNGYVGTQSQQVRQILSQSPRTPAGKFQREASDASVDCSQRTPLRIRRDTNTPVADIQDAESKAVQILTGTVKKLQAVLDGGASHTILLMVYLRMQRYLMMFKGSTQLPSEEGLREEMQSLVVRSMLENLVYRFSDRYIGLINSGKLEYECLSRGKDCARTTNAWTQYNNNNNNNNNNTIHLCRNFWRNTPQERALTLIHEISHILHEEVGDEGESLRNAYCITGFAASVKGTPYPNAGECESSSS